MIKNDEEFNHSVKKLELSRNAQRLHKEQLVQEGLSPEQIKRMLDPVECFLDQIQFEVDSYQRLKRGNLDEIQNLHNMGDMLIGVRIALGLSTADMAAKLGVDEATVIQHERDDYYNVTVEQASRMLDTLGVVMTSRFEKVPTLAQSA